LGQGVVARLTTGQGVVNLGRSSFRLRAIRQGSWMLIATVVAGVFNYFSNVLVGRMLGPADYSIFTSLVSVFMILGVLTGVVQTVTSNYTARLRAQGAVAEAGALFVHLASRLLPWGMGGTLLLALLSGPLSAFLRIPSQAPVIVLSLVVIPAVVLPVAYGALGGLQRFGALGATQIGSSIFRLIAVVALIALGLGAAGAVASLFVSNLGALVLGTILLQDVLRRRKKTIAVSGLFEYSLYAMLATVAFTMLINSDLIVVKNRFSPTEAGLYSAIATLGKITLWLPGAIGVLLLPKVTERHAHRQSTVSLLWKGLLATCLLCGGFIVVFFLFPTPLMRILFGEPYVVHASLLGLYGLAMTFYSLVNVWLYYYLAVQEKRYSYVLLAGAVLQVILLMILRLTMTGVIELMIAIGACLSLIGVLGVVNRHTPESEP
jgi:O-antigen/teichoic acid export membrane protein